MGVVPSVGYEKFPQQGDLLRARVEVCSEYDTSRRISGSVVRDDAEEPGILLIRLDDGRYVLSTECQFRILHRAPRDEPASEEK